MNPIPRELALGDVYFSPLIPVIAVALLTAWLTVILLNKSRLSRYIVFPSSTFLAIIASYMLLLDAFWLKL